MKSHSSCRKVNPRVVQTRNAPMASRAATSTSRKTVAFLAIAGGVGGRGFVVSGLIATG